MNGQQACAARRRSPEKAVSWLPLVEVRAIMTLDSKMIFQQRPVEHLSLDSSAVHRWGWGCYRAVRWTGSCLNFTFQYMCYGF